ncbi:MORN repeat protein [Leptospira weilii serovar Ranarum str. ICFT]|uniref:MORN repeat protein n=1 Tax=Leptospira weilii serovar Ranarum str. ICFT TaxID=1218598 RepID=N1WEK7_9LEPT|nr:MORN repeat protein [Leptospira weilii]EMY78681.1 MORN repeat protein [Leptospira weilii serovar Ranarum str. ICFT]
MVLFGSNPKIIFTLGIILLSFALTDCGKKNKGTAKKENTSSSKKKNDLDLEPELKERKFFQEDALGQPKKYAEPEDSNHEIDRPHKQETKSSASYLGSSPGCKDGNCKNGQGIYVYDTGEVYSGSFKNDKRHGTGNIHYRDGDKYSGYFQNDKKVGTGTYRFANGAVFSGRFYDDGESAEGYLNVGKKRKECSIIRNKLSCHG